MVISANGNWVEHADHKAAMDALAAQAVALATEVLNCHGEETERHITVSMGCSSRECEFVNSEIDKRNTARLLAQALLDAQGRKG
jgi:hypothetical protein